MTTTAWGFIQPRASLADLPVEAIHQELAISIKGGHRASFDSFRGANKVFDDIAARAGTFSVGYEDQCSAKYYFDLFDCLRSCYGEIDRVVEVGVFMGGASVILAGCGEKLDFELDLVDVNPRFLLFSYERIRRTFPEQARRVRLFLGDLPTYVRDVLLQEPNVTAMVQHDGSHEFNQVVRDLGSLHYAHPRIHSLAIQDTHLRGLPHQLNFVDAAVCAVFGFEAVFAPLGTSYSEYDHDVTTPNRFEGNYFLPGRPEGMYLTMAANTFHYPHPAISLESFLPKPSP